MTEDNIRQIWSDADLDAALADLHGDASSGSAADLSFARATLLSAAGVEAESEPAASKEGRAKKRVGSWRWIAVAAAVVTLTGGLAIAVGLAGPPDPDLANPGQSMTLGELDRPLAPGEFHYAKKTIWQPMVVATDRPTVYIEITTELWIPADPNGVWHRRWSRTGNVRGQLAPPEQVKLDQDPKGFDEFGPAGLFPSEPHAGGQYMPASNTPFANWNAPDAKFIASLVPDQATLTKRLLYDTTDVPQRSKSGMHSAQETLGMVRNTLAVGLLRKDVRIALLQALAQVPGIMVTEGTTTPNGLPATAYIAKETREVLYVDAATSQLIAASTIDVTPNFPPSAAIQLSPSSTSINIPATTSTTIPQTPLTSGSKPASIVMPTMTTRPGIPSAPPGAADVTYIFSITENSGR